MDGKFASPMGAGVSGEAAVDDFIAKAQANGMDVVGKRVTVKTIVGNREIDVVVRDAAGGYHGIEIKSSQSAFEHFDAYQFAADRFINQYGAEVVGQWSKLERIETSTRVLWAG